MEDPASGMVSAMQTFAEIRRIQNFEAVENDPNIIGTFVAELGRGGRVNLNRRIYPGQEFKRVNEDLNRRISAGLVAPGEENHPNFLNGPTFQIPVILQEVTTVDEAPGVVRAEGKFAITNTQSGRDIKTLHELGVPIGVSSKMYARPEGHVIDRASEFYAANMDFEGEEVAVMRDLAFDETGPYDLVRVPSAGTFVRSQEALAVESRLVTEGVLIPLPVEEPALPLADNNPAPEANDPNGADMELQEKIEALEAELTEIREKAEQETVRADEAEAKLAEVTEASLALETAKTEAEEKAVSLEARLEEIRETAEGEFADRLAELQSAHEQTRQELQALQAEKAKNEHAAKMAKAVVEAAEGDHKDLVEAELVSLVNEGTLTDPEKVAEHATRIRALCAKVAEAAAVPEGTSGHSAPDDDDDTPAPAAITHDEGVLPAFFVDHMNRLHSGLNQEN